MTASKMPFVAVILAISISPGVNAGTGNWVYDTQEDKMRGERYDYAMVTSLNEADFNFPYNGGSSLQIGIRKKNGKLDAIMLAISKGQILCGFSGCSGAVKFGAGKVDTLTLLEPENHSSTLVFVKYDRNFLENVRKNDKVIIELSFFQEGAKQFEFDIGGLKF